MITDNKNSLIKLYKQRIKNFKFIERPSNTNLKRSFLKAKTNSLSTHLNFPEFNDKTLNNSKIIFHEKKENNSPLILPSISDTLINNKLSLNSSMKNIFNNNSTMTPNKKYNNIKLKKFKIKKSNEYNELFTPNKQKKSLINLYKENLRLKQRLEKYKIKKAENIGSFSYKKYNYNLVKYSSIDLSKDSIKSFQKNMKTIEDNMNGTTFKRKNRWMIFLDKIGNFAPEGLKKKIKSLSDRRYQKAENDIDILN